MSYLVESIPIKIKVTPRPTQIPSTMSGNNPNLFENKFIPLNKRPKAM